MQEQFLQIEEVPGGFRWVRRVIRVCMVLQWGVGNERQEHQRQRKQQRGDELDEHEVRPYQNLFIPFAPGSAFSHCSRLRAPVHPQ